VSASARHVHECVVIRAIKLNDHLVPVLYEELCSGGPPDLFFLHEILAMCKCGSFSGGPNGLHSSKFSCSTRLWLRCLCLYLCATSL